MACFIVACKHTFLGWVINRIILSEKGLIYPVRMSVKECKMQIALGTDINIGFGLTELGIYVECLDHNVTCDERLKKLKKLRELEELRKAGLIIK